jgi:hypothetical protein
MGDRLLEGVDDGLAEVAGRDLLFEQHVELSVCPALWLRKAEEDPDGADGACACLEEAGLSAPVPSRWIQHHGC